MKTDMTPDQNDPFETRLRATLHAAADKTAIDDDAAGDLASPLASVTNLDDGGHRGKPGWWGLAAAACVALVLGVSIAVREPNDNIVIGPLVPGSTSSTSPPGGSPSTAAKSGHFALPKLRFDYLPDGMTVGSTWDMGNTEVRPSQLTTWGTPTSKAELIAQVSSPGDAQYDRISATLPISGAVVPESDFYRTVQINNTSAVLQQGMGEGTSLAWSTSDGTVVSLTGLTLTEERLIPLAAAITLEPVQRGWRAVLPETSIPTGMIETYGGPHELSALLQGGEQISLARGQEPQVANIIVVARGFDPDAYRKLLSSPSEVTGNDGMTFVSGSFPSIGALPLGHELTVGGTDAFTVHIDRSLSLTEREKVARGIHIDGWWSDTDRPPPTGLPLDPGTIVLDPILPDGSLGSLPTLPAPGSKDIWPKEAPRDYCAGWKVFFDVQFEAVGPQSVQTDGFRRYTTQIAALAPDDLGKSWTKLRDLWLDPNKANIDDAADGSGAILERIYEASKVLCNFP